MIRLAVFGANEECWQEIARRLRGAMLWTDGNSAPGDEPLPTCDAAAFFGPSMNALAIERFLNAGKHVLLAAEAGLSKGRLQALTGLAAKSNVRLAVVNLDRYLPSRQLIRQQLDAGKLGEPGLVRLHRWEPTGVDAVGDPQDLPGGQLRDLELVSWLFGRPPNLVYAVAQGRADSSRPASIQIHLGFSGGGMALLDHAQRWPMGESYGSLSVIASRGAAYADDHQNMQLVFRTGSALAVRTDEGVLPWSTALQEFVEALNTGRDLAAHLTAWHNALAVGAAVQESLRTRQAAIPEGLR